MGINLPNIDPFNLEQVNTGINPNDGQGDVLPESFRKINRNLTRLTNVLTSGTPFTIYVNPHSNNATDAPSNKGINANTPFKTIQRALIQAAALSAGLATGGVDDLYDLVSIKLEVGSYRVENSPGQPNTNTINTITELNKDGDFEQVCAPYAHFNPSGIELAADQQPTNIFGGLIVPRGVSIIGSDLRKAKIRPIYTGVNTGNIRRTSVFRLTGGSHVYGLSIFDKQGSTESQHNCDCFSFVSRAELELYYQKIAKAFVNLLSIQDWTEVSIQDRPVAPTTAILGVREEEFTIVGAATNPQNTNVVESSSPFVFNVSSRSIRGRNGINADGRIVEGFKSMVCANFTGIGLNNSSEAYTNGDPNSTEAEFKPGYRNFHIKAVNDAFIEVVSCFAISYADQYVTESGGEISMTASKSDFGQTSLKSIGFQRRAYPKDAQGQIVALIPPKGLDPSKENVININRVNVERTITESHNNADFRRLYIGSAIAQEDIPEYIENPGLTQEKRWLLIGNGKYLLGKKAGAAEIVTLNLYDYYNLNNISFTTRDFRDTLRSKITNGLLLDPITNNNDKRQFYTWEPISPETLDSNNRPLGNLYIHVHTPPTVGVANYSDSNGKNILFRLFRKSPITDEFEFLTRVIFTELTTTRVVDARKGVAPSELMWQIQYRIPKEAVNVAPPDRKFVVQSRVGTADVNNVFWIYDVQTVTQHIAEQQDGLYNLILIWGNVPIQAGMVGTGHSQNLNFLYPEVDLDNTRWNPISSTSFYDPQLGTSVISSSSLSSHNLDRITQYSLSRETTDRLISSFNIRKVGSNSAFSTTAPYDGATNTWGMDKDTEERKVLIQPVNVELRRPSMLIALGHAWHYVGYGTGNYQKSLPKNHKVTLTTQQLINARGLEQNAGVVAATGTTATGDFFIGNQLFDNKGTNNRTFNTPKLLTSAEARAIDYTNTDALISNQLSDFAKNQSQSFSTTNLTVTGTTTTTNLIVTQEVNFSDAITFTPVSTKDRPGLISLATIDDIIEGFNDTKAVTPAAIAEILKSFRILSKDNFLNKNVFNVRLSCYFAPPEYFINKYFIYGLESSRGSDANLTTYYNSDFDNNSIFLHPYGGNELGIYDTETENWILVPLQNNTTPTNPMQFRLSDIGVFANSELFGLRYFSVYAYNAGSLNNPLVGLMCVLAPDETSLFNSFKDGVEVWRLDFGKRFLGVIRVYPDGTLIKERPVFYPHPPLPRFSTIDTGLQSIQWTRLIGSTSEDDLNGITMGSDNFIYAAGTTLGDLGSLNNNSYDVFIVKYSSNGNRIWLKTLGYNDVNQANVITASSDGFIYVGGTLYLTSLFKNVAFIAKFNSDGNLLWTRTPENTYRTSALAAGSDGSIYAAGQDLFARCFIVKYSSDGLLRWIKNFGTGNTLSLKFSLTIDNDGYIYVAGTTTSDLNGQTVFFNNLPTAYIVKYNSNGDIIWTRLVPMQSIVVRAYVSSLITGLDGSIYIGGYYQENQTPKIYGFIAKYNTNSSNVWIKYLEDKSITSLTRGFDGLIYAVVDGISITVYNPIGNVIWTRDFMTKLEGYAVSLTAGFDSSLYLGGTTASNINLNGEINNGRSDAFITKLLVDTSSSFLSIEPTNATIAEGNSGSTPFTFTVTRTGNTNVFSSVDWAVTGIGINPANAEDFWGVFPSGTVNFAIGQTSANITVNVRGDTQVEADETFLVTLSNPRNATIATATAAGTILNDDFSIVTPEDIPNLSIAPTNATRNEGNSSFTLFTFTVTRTGNTTDISTVDWAVTGTGSNPANAADFLDGAFPSGTVTFATGQTSANITVNVQGDTQVEPDETFRVTLSNPSNATITTATATGTILNDDIALPELAIIGGLQTKIEGSDGGSVAFNWIVTRTGNLNVVSRANWIVTGLGFEAADAFDFVGGVMPSGQIEFAPFATSANITILVNSDTWVEPDERFTVTLSNPHNATILAGTAGIGVIINDD
jgi:hypothetical protein